MSLNNLAEAVGSNDRQLAETLLREAVSIGRSLQGGHQEGLAESLDALAFVVMRGGDHEAARAFYEEALALVEELHGEESGEAYSVLNNIGVLEEFRGDFETARSLYLKMLSNSEERGSVNVNVSVNLGNVGWVDYEEGNFANAKRRFRESLSMLEKVYTGPNPTSAYTRASLATTLVSLGEYPEAAALFAKAIEASPHIADFLETPSSQRSAQMASAYGRLLTTEGRYDEAEARLLAALAVLERDLPPDDPRTRRARRFFVELCDVWGKPDKAAEYRALLPAEEAGGR